MQNSKSQIANWKWTHPNPDPSPLTLCRSSTTVENPLQISSFLTNKPNFPDAQMNVSPILTKDYKNEPPWQTRKTKPIKPNFKIGKMNTTFFTTKPYANKQRTMDNEHRSKQTQSNPILSRRSPHRSSIPLPLSTFSPYMARSPGLQWKPQANVMFTEITN